MKRDLKQDEKTYNKQRTEYVLYEKRVNEPTLIVESLKEAREYALQFRMARRNIMVVKRTIIEELLKS